MSAGRPADEFPGLPADEEGGELEGEGELEREGGLDGESGIELEDSGEGGG